MDSVRCISLIKRVIQVFVYRKPDCPYIIFEQFFLILDMLLKFRKFLCCFVALFCLFVQIVIGCWKSTMLPTQQNKSLLNSIATTISPAETEVCRTLENTTCSDQVLPISILPLNFVKRQTQCYFHFHLR